jgi:hypothetical protein
MIRTVDPRSLSRGQQRAIQTPDSDREDNPSFADVAEEIVSEEYNLEGLSLDPDWWDLHAPERSTKYQVKSTQTSIGQEYPARGRFRVWESQTRSLIASDAQATAWFAFVWFEEESGLLRIRRMRPSTVLRIVNETGGWAESGHESMGRQAKIDIGEVFDEA